MRWSLQATDSRSREDRSSCVWLSLRAVLIADYGQPAAARALNGFAAPIGDRCGERWHVPQLTGAAGGLG